jgi:hypothetical protein
MATQSVEPAVERAKLDESSRSDNVQVVDFSRGSDAMTQSVADPASGQLANSLADVVPFPRPKRVREKAECSGIE